ncbi:MAG: hypothetical protein ACOCX4_06590, partial [Planctomycetota bacterium]
MSDEVVAAVAGAVRSALAVEQGMKTEPGRRPASDSPLASGNPVRVTLLRDGRVVGAAEHGASSILANARLAVALALSGAGGAEATADAGDAPDRNAPPPDCLVEIRLPPRPWTDNKLYLPQHMDGGRQGLLVHAGDRRGVATASEIVLAGSGTDRLYGRELRALAIEPAMLLGDGVRVEVYDAVLVLIRPDADPVRLYRNATVVPVDAVDRAAVRTALDRATAWYAVHQRDVGGFPYVYHPTADQAIDASPSLLRHVFNVAAIGTLQAEL